MSKLSVYDAMSTLRAVRRQRPDPIPEQVLQRVLQAAVWAPSGGNAQPWRIIVVRDLEKKKRLRDLYRAEWQGFVELYRQRIGSLPEEQQAKEQRTLAAGDFLAENFHRSPIILMFCFHPGMMAITDAKLDRPSVVGGGSVYPAVQNALLACRVEGLGCTITTLLCQCEPQVKELLKIPKAWFTCAAVPIGYPASKGHGPLTRRPVESMVFIDEWDTK